MNDGNMLQVKALSKTFGGLLAVRDYHLELTEHEIVGLIGPNGAGKTTVINMLSGLETPTVGDITFLGYSLKRRTAQKIARLGLVRTFQNLRLFGEFSVRDNVVAGLLVQPHYTVFDALLRSRRFLRGERRLQEEADELLDQVGLIADAEVQASALPYGKQRRLEIARALALRPRLLLLDEPAAGMVEEEQRDLSQLLRDLRREGLSLLVIDHNIRFFAELSRPGSGHASRPTYRRGRTQRRGRRPCCSRSVSRAGAKSVSTAEVLGIKELHVSYGRVRALAGVSLQLYQGQVVALLGANGAGKSTLLKAVSRLVSLEQGSVALWGEDVSNRAPEQIAALGVAHVPEGRGIFAQLSVRENLLMGAYRAPPSEHAARFETVTRLFPRLRERWHQRAGNLSGGEQQMLALGRALAMEPKLLLLDEPSLGLSPLLARETFAAVKEINQRGVSVLVVEQNAQLAFSVADYVYVLRNGRIDAHGAAEEVRSLEQVKRAYLGVA